MDSDAYSVATILLFIVALVKFDWIYDRIEWLVNEIRYPGGKEEE
jgi:hypothetical protein